MKNFKTEEIGKVCKEYRESLGIKQKDVARETNYCQATISSFEKGRTDNCRIFIWYLMQGLTIKNFKGVGE